MPGPRDEIIVGVLGQWASGKSTAASTLVNYLGGESEVIFITDRALLAAHAVNHIRELPASTVKRSVDNAGKQRLEGELATVYISPGEDLETSDLNMLLFDLNDDVYDNAPAGSFNWFDEIRLELGSQILEQSKKGKPIVIEAGFGTNTDPRGENPFRHTISDLFKRLEEAGVEPKQVRWIIIEASYETRSERNRRRKDTVPAVEFDRFAADGGDLDPDDQEKWIGRGMKIFRVMNNYDDVEKFREDIVAAFEDLYTASQLEPS